jgi:hypothetical protein
MCHFLAPCISIIKNTLKSACTIRNSNTKPQETKIHSQGHKTLTCGTKVYVGLEAQIHMDKKNTKPQEAEIQSQGHKTLMYGTRVHAWQKLKSTIKIKENTKPWKDENPQGHETHVWKKID